VIATQAVSGLRRDPALASERAHRSRRAETSLSPAARVPFCEYDQGALEILRQIKFACNSCQSWVRYRQEECSQNFSACHGLAV